MNKKSAGILLYRYVGHSLEFLLVHPGGPLWAKSDVGAWSIPKGEFGDPEDALEAAKREFFEETGKAIDGEFYALTPRKLKSGKTVYAFAVEATLDVNDLQSNEFEIEWPPKSGKRQSFPEIDKAGWFSATLAKEKINAGQVGIIEEIVEYLEGQKTGF